MEVAGRKAKFRMSSVDVMSELQIQTEQDLSKFRKAVAAARASFPAPAPKRFQSEEELFAHIEAIEATRASSNAKAAPLKTYPNNGPDAKAIEFVRKFVMSGERSMDVRGNSFKRRQIHEAAAYLVNTEGFKISHESHGAGFTRCLVLRNLLMMPEEKEKGEAKAKASACGCLAEETKYCICKEF